MLAAAVEVGAEPRCTNTVRRPGTLAAAVEVGAEPRAHGGLTVCACAERVSTKIKRSKLIRFIDTVRLFYSAKLQRKT